MAHEILSFKLCQLDDRLEKLHSRIRMSETADHSQLRREIGQLERECTETELALRSRLQLSKSALVTVLSRSYGEMEQIIRRAEADLRGEAETEPDGDAWAEAKLLLAEYALDFAQQAADRALLLSMDAIDTELARREGTERSQS